MQVMEQDAKERQERKRESKRKAEMLKQKGNSEFSQRNYEKAIEFYTEVNFKCKINCHFYLKYFCFVSM